MTVVLAVLVQSGLVSAVWYLQPGMTSIGSDGSDICPLKACPSEVKVARVGLRRI